MIKWAYEQMNLMTFWFEIQDKYGHKIYPASNVSAPAMSILKEILTDYVFAKKIYNTNTIFNDDKLTPEDQMDIKMCCINRLEDIDDN